MGASLSLCAGVLLLMCGRCSVGFAAEEFPKSIAVIEEVDGLVRVTRASGGRTEEAEEDQRLVEGDRIDTLEDGRVTISLEDEHLVKLSPNTSLKIKGLRSSRGAGGFWASFKLTAGRLFGSFGALTGADSVFEVETATAVAAVKGTTFSIELQGEIDTTVSVLDGTVVVATLDRKGGRRGAVKVFAGKETKVKGWAKRPILPYGIAKKRMAVLHPGLKGLKVAAKRHREMRKSGDLKKLRKCRTLARAGRLGDADGDLKKFMKRNADLRKRIKKHGERHQKLKKLGQGKVKRHKAVRKERPKKTKRERIAPPKRSRGGHGRGGGKRKK